MISQQAKEKTHESLAMVYRGLWSIENTEALVEEFSHQCEDADFLEAVRRHRHDKTETAKGTPVGQYPPTPANIEVQLVAIHTERMRARNEKRQAELKKESDQTYLAAVAGQGQSADERAQMWGRRIQEQIRKAAALRRILEVRFKLDYTRQDHTKLLMQTLGEADMLSQSLEEIIELAGEIAGEMGIVPAHNTHPTGG